MALQGWKTVSLRSLVAVDVMLATFRSSVGIKLLSIVLSSSVLHVLPRFVALEFALP